MKILSILTVLALAACGSSYQPETLEYLERNPSAQTTANLPKIDASVRAMKLVRSAGEESGYWKCLGDTVGPGIHIGRQQPIPPTDSEIERLVVLAEEGCTAPRVGFMAALRTKAPAANFDPNFREIEMDAMVHELWIRGAGEMLRAP